MKRFIYSIVLVLISSMFSLATIINVPADSATIQGGINMAVNGDTVLVQPGTYVENINFIGKNIVVGSLTLTTGNTSYISQTVIDGDSSYRVVTIANGEDSTAVLCGFTLTNGYADDSDGGGIYVSGSSPHLSYLLIKNNIATVNMVFYDGGNGGGIFLAGSNTILENVSVKNNYASGWDGSAGGGIHITNSNPVLVNVEVIGNAISWPQGGGIYCNDSDPIFSNVTVTGNSAPIGGGIAFQGDCNPVFDPVNRSNIYFNNTLYDKSNDIAYHGDSLHNITIVLDTFTVLNPTEYFADPLHNLTFDILNAKIEPIMSDLYVNPNGDDSNSGISPTEPLKTINFALMKILADSLNPHTIYLADGIYSPSNTGEIYPLRMRDYVSLYGESLNGVILDAENLSNIMAFIDDKGITIENMTITGGLANYGGAINCSHSDPYFTNILITGNMAKWGGGIAMRTGYNWQAEETRPTFSNVTISNNTAYDNGGGIFCWHSLPSLFNVTIKENTAENDGGGIYCFDADPVFSTVILSKNAAGYGGGFYSVYSEPTFLNATIYGNNASDHGGAICIESEDSLKLINTIIWENTPENLFTRYNGEINIFYSDIQGDWPGVGNIDAEPMFVDTANGDYRLQSGSPCIDAGTAFFEFGGDTLINLNPWQYNGSDPDMGAYEFGPSLGITEDQNTPKVYTLKQNYPNPFNPSTTIEFNLPKTCEVNLKVFNILGEEVATLVSDRLSAGTYSYEWSRTGELASGVYLYRLHAGGYVETRKMVLMR